MNTDTALWIGLAAGAIAGTTATWISIWAAIALGRHLARTAMRHSIATPDDGDTWETLDVDYRRLLDQETGR